MFGGVRLEEDLPEERRDRHKFKVLASCTGSPNYCCDTNTAKVVEIQNLQRNESDLIPEVLDGRTLRVESIISFYLFFDHLLLFFFASFGVIRKVQWDSF